VNGVMGTHRAGSEKATRSPWRRSQIPRTGSLRRAVIVHIFIIRALCFGAEARLEYGEEGS
jgi:hypothetical protein